MTNKELANEIRAIITYLTKEAHKQDAYALQCCDELDKKMDVLDLFQNALTLSVSDPLYAQPGVIEQLEDGSLSVSFKKTCEYIKNELDKLCIQRLTEWVKENIDKETLRGWLDETSN